ncbi:hypothetical protein GALL_225590 [mine drainage metagenome]|uniref:Uncharacterized protein n=1 Tax=mine drainage metagenome TaxID=410659 RepID=A0A1J5RH31_9ZZZZ
MEGLLVTVRAPAIRHRCIEILHGTPATARQHTRQSFAAGLHHQPATARNGAHQMMELGFDGAEIGKDVGMVVFQVVQHGRARAVMHELRPLVEKRRVVLVGLHHEKAGLAQTRGSFEIHRHAADQKTGAQSRMLENPGQHGRRRRLAMGARHGQGPTPCKNMLGQPLRPADIGLAGVQNGFHQGVAARDCIAHHPELGFERQLIGTIALDQADAQALKLIAHRRIDLGVTARDLMPASLGKCCDSTHEGAADSENMDMHRPIVENRQWDSEAAPSAPHTPGDVKPQQRILAPLRE